MSDAIPAAEASGNGQTGLRRAAPVRDSSNQRRAVLTGAVVATQFDLADSATAGVEHGTLWPVCTQYFKWTPLRLLACNMTPLVAFVLCLMTLLLVALVAEKPILPNHGHVPERESATARPAAVTVAVGRTSEGGEPLEDSVPVITLGDPIRYLAPEVGDRAPGGDGTTGPTYSPGMVRFRTDEQHHGERPTASRQQNETSRLDNQTKCMHPTLVVAVLEHRLGRQASLSDGSAHRARNHNGGPGWRTTRR